jgi:hypothetical protein
MKEKPNRIKEFLDREPVDRRKNADHPWKKPFSARQAKNERERKKEMKLFNID